MKRKQNDEAGSSGPTETSREGSIRVKGQGPPSATEGTSTVDEMDRDLETENNSKSRIVRKLVLNT